MKLACVILAAGSGTRMNSNLPKVLHGLYNMPMLQYAMDAAAGLKPQKTVIVAGKNHQLLKDSVRPASGLTFAVQGMPRGTADALLCAAGKLQGFGGTTLVLNGDMPLITSGTLRRFLGLHKRHKNTLSAASFITDDAGSYGRVFRDKKGKAVRIIEALDAKEGERAIKEANSGIYAIEPAALPLLAKIGKNRIKGEYYITDLYEITGKQGLRTGIYPMGGEDEFMGINTMHDLLKAQEALRKRQVMFFVKKGVKFIDADSVFIHPYATIGRETLVYPNVYLDGKTKIGMRCVIYPNVRIIDSTVENNAQIKDSTLIEESVIGHRAQIGPFAHIRPGSSIGPSAKIGNFVEVKKSAIGKGTKAMHLSYIGDAAVGRDVNIGAGTITCNYNGFKKHRTVIEDNVFVGSGTQLVAPVRVKKGSYIGAGSTITKNVPPGSLALSRVKQKNIEGWVGKKTRIPGLTASDCKKTKKKR
ncbi:MAG: bifunctional UDP-N-acetylglucosamine diphosphorylase/glucosamine-1-phosphate N-acetyltransferase GlmU [Thermodesulfovibrionales bacterium]|nr:bifunctional UDP-N-acetylglucosamine diphosphorylase/glucosamine-1-phosphate N-acetyltransferase GlmU [Thermodesulfovibrionales bacterium]